MKKCFNSLQNSKTKKILIKFYLPLLAVITFSLILAFDLLRPDFSKATQTNSPVASSHRSII